MIDQETTGSQNMMIRKVIHTRLYERSQRIRETEGLEKEPSMSQTIERLLNQTEHLYASDPQTANP